MAVNYPGPYQVRIYYSVDTSPGGVREHIARFNVDPTTEPDPMEVFSNINVEDSDGSPVALSTAVDALVGFMADFYNSTDATFTHAELYKMLDQSFTGIFVSAYTLNVAGDSAQATVPASQTVFTFRTAEGGLMKCTLMETVVTPGQAVLPANFGTPEDNLTGLFINSSNEVFLGRDTSYPIAVLRMLPGQNEATFKSRYR